MAIKWDKLPPVGWWLNKRTGDCVSTAELRMLVANCPESLGNERHGKQEIWWPEGKPPGWMPGWPRDDCMALDPPIKGQVRLVL